MVYGDNLNLFNIQASSKKNLNQNHQQDEFAIPKGKFCFKYAKTYIVVPLPQE